jgi:ribonuclease Z
VGRTQEIEPFCREADALVIEATYLQDELEMAREFAHLTARQAAELALRAGVRHLILTHLSRRYRERDVLAEARAIFPATRGARDFDAFQVRRGELLKIRTAEGEAEAEK